MASQADPSSILILRLASLDEENNSTSSSTLSSLSRTSSSETIYHQSMDDHHPHRQAVNPSSSPGFIMTPDLLTSANPFTFRFELVDPFLSNASAPLTQPQEDLVPVRVEINGQLEDLIQSNEYPFSDECELSQPFLAGFSIPVDNNLTNDEDDRKENIDESPSGLLGSQRLYYSKEDETVIAGGRTQSTQRSQPTQSDRSQENNILQVKSLSNSFFSSLEYASPPLVITTSPSPSNNSFVRTGPSFSSQSSSSEEVTCCRKHVKYFQRKANKKIEKVCKTCDINFTDLYMPLDGHNYLKPGYSHNMLCAFAIWCEDYQKREVSEIYSFLIACFPYFETADLHWKNSLRHSLATCDWFIKSEIHRTAKKGFKWTLNPEKKRCLCCEIRKQSIKDISKLYHCLANPGVCEQLIGMGLLALDSSTLSQLRKSNSQVKTCKNI